MYVEVELRWYLYLYQVPTVRCPVTRTKSDLGTVPTSVPDPDLDPLDHMFLGLPLEGQ